MTIPYNELHDPEEPPDTGTFIPMTAFAIAMKWLPISEYTDEHFVGYVPGRAETSRE